MPWPFLASGLFGAWRFHARASGGTFIQGKDLKFFAQKILRRDAFYYFLGYHGPPTDETGRYRAIKVKTRRKGVKLKYRRGYFGG